MTIAGVLALFVGFCISLAFASSFRRNSLLVVYSIFLYFWHTAFSIVYWYSSLTESADSNNYLDYSLYSRSFGSGTQFVVWLLAMLRSIFDFPSAPAANLDYFLMFNIFGYIGLMVLLKILVTLAAERLPQLFPVIFVMCSLPGINYWNSAIGKDGLTFLGIALVVYASMNFHRRLPWLVLGTILVALIRPHVAALLVITYLFLLFSNLHMSMLTRAIGLAVGALAIFFIWPILLERLGVIELNPSAAAQYISNLATSNSSSSSAVNIADEPLPLKIITYLFRPLFVDARRFTGFVASMENVVLIILFGNCIRFIFGKLGKILADPTLAFNFIFFALATLLLASATYNIGIADRQKTMLMPSAFVVAIWLLREGLARVGQRSVSAPYGVTRLRRGRI